MIIHRHKSALAFSGGVMGGDSFSDSDSDSDDDYLFYDWEEKHRPKLTKIQDKDKEAPY